MPLRVRLITRTYLSGAFTSLYLHNSNNRPTAGGDPGIESTTPFSVNARSWTQTASPRRTLYGGSPPFRIGRQPEIVGFDTVTETVEIGIAGSSVDNMIDNLQILRRALNAALVGAPTVLEWQPNGATAAAYYEIYSADVQEVGDWQNPSAGFTQVLCRVTWTRSAFGSRLATGQTLLNAVNYGASGFFGNIFSSSVVGDLRFEGQPMNLTFNFASGGPLVRAFASTARDYTPDGSAATPVSTTSQTGIDAISITTNPSGLFAVFSSFDRRVRARMLVRTTFGAGASNIELQTQIRTKVSNVVLYSSPWINPDPDPASGITDVVIDMGGWDPSSILDSNATQAQFNYYVRLRSTNGTSAAITYQQSYWIPYYTWCQIDWANLSNANGRADAFQERSNRATLPWAQPFIGALDKATGNIYGIGSVRGQLPLAIDDSILFASWGSSFGTGTNGSIISSPGAVFGVLTFTATQSPLYTTLRGAG